MDYQLLALDLDGTLTNSKKEVSEPTIKALIQIQEQGKKVVLASGRPTRGVVPLAEKLHLKDYGSYILSFNGGRITDCRTGQVIYNKTIPDDVALPLAQIFSPTQKIPSYPGSDRTNIQNWNPALIICKSFRQKIFRKKSRSLPISY